MRPDKRARKEIKPGPPIPVRYTGQTVAIVASGPSATCEDVDYCRARGWPVWAINTSYMLGCDSIYACDYRWWREHHKSAKKATADCWTHSQRAAEEFGIAWVKGLPLPGFSENPCLIHEGRNSGYQCLNLVCLMGAARILLLGFDMRYVNGKKHHHGDHPKPLANPKSDTLVEYAALFDTVQLLPCEVWNCTAGSAIQRFPFASVRDL